MEQVPSYRSSIERRLSPIESLEPSRPAVFISVGGGELGDLAVTAAKRYFGGKDGGLKVVAFDRYNGFPAQDVADHYECFDMMNGDMLEKAISMCQTRRLLIQYILRLRRLTRIERLNLAWRKATK
jgi:formate-dependent phosphoribosylglycinamide formyltransferase (GAR transformylase)